MKCRICTATCVKFGRTKNGTQKYRCKPCRKVYVPPRRRVGSMLIPFERAQLAAHLLVEGCSVRSVSRLTGLRCNTVLSLLEYLGKGCDALLRKRIRGFQPSHLEIDEIWTYVCKKQKRVKRGDPRVVGDAYCFIALDRATRLVVAWHLGKRDESSTNYFITKVRDATAGKFQISSDGFEAYPWAIATGLHDRATHGRIVKVTRPGRVEAGFGDPDLDQTETTYVERLNGTLRQWCKRYQRVTYAFSKKWENLEHALALHFAYYNFCHVHQTLEVTPAMEAGFADEPWSVDDLVERAV